MAKSGKRSSKSCKYCSKTFPLKSIHDLHVQIEHRKTFNLRRACVFCARPFLVYRDLEIHYRRHTLERPFFCNICDVEKVSKEELEGHIKTHQDLSKRELNFPCDLCHKKFFTSGGLNQHRKTHEGDKRNIFKCEICHRMLQSPRNLRVHMETHKGEENRERPFGCDLCPKRFFTPTLLKIHRQCHEEGGSFQCDPCKKQFKWERSLQKHIRNHHNQIRERKVSCHLCPSKFFGKSGLVSHLKAHGGIRAFKCDLCEASFSLKRGLNRHYSIVHVKSKPFQCEICKHKFSLNQNLKSHMERLKGKCLEILNEKINPNQEGYFECKVCKKELKTRSGLQKHLETHEGVRERKFSCDVCKEKFFTRDTLRIHMQRHNGFKCKACNTMFVSRFKKEQHEAAVHGKRGPWVTQVKKKSKRSKGQDRKTRLTSKGNKKETGNDNVSIKTEPQEEGSYTEEDDTCQEMMVTEVKYEF